MSVAPSNVDGLSKAKPLSSEAKFGSNKDGLRFRSAHPTLVYIAEVRTAGGDFTNGNVGR